MERMREGEGGREGGRKRQGDWDQQGSDSVETCDSMMNFLLWSNVVLYFIAYSLIMSRNLKCYLTLIYISASYRVFRIKAAF